MAINEGRIEGAVVRVDAGFAERRKPQVMGNLWHSWRQWGLQNWCGYAVFLLLGKPERPALTLSAPALLE